MVKAPAAAAAAAGPGIYSATYSGIPVYEYQFGADLKEHVMRRRHDDWINATHILKAAGFDKPARTRILEREVQKETHEKIQGGYGKYQGTWIPLKMGEALAQRNSVYDRLRPIFEFVPGNESPPPAPRHTSKPKAPKRPAVPKWSNPPIAEDFDSTDLAMNEDDTPDNLTVASASYAAEDDRPDMSHFSTGHRKRKREDLIHDMTQTHHSVYGDELLDYFLLSRNEQPAIRPDPPTNFQPDWPIDTERHTALHWASAMGDVDIIKQLKRFGPTLSAQNIRGETPFMRAVNFTNCYERQTFPAVMKELFETVDARDSSGCTVIHHAAVIKGGRVTSQSCSRYYLDNILNKLVETHDPAFVQHLIDAQDHEGNTAIHHAAMRNATKCIRALLGRGASTHISNTEGVRVEDLIRDLNANKKSRAAPQRSSSPFAPDSQMRTPFRDALGEVQGRLSVTHQSDAAKAIQARITPLITDKFQELAQRYDEELKDKEDAEKEAQRILQNTQAELAAVQAQIAALEAQLEPDAMAAQVENEAAVVRKQVLALVTHQNRLAVQRAVDTELSMTNGAGGNANGAGSGGGGDESYEERVRLAKELRKLLADQREAEADYVDALSAVGTGENIERYRRLLKSCLGPEAENLDDNLDDMIAMMEEEASDVVARNGGGGGGGLDADGMDLAA
ncbi:uncharacterized protein E0L32_011814 [Thyridium curvatum]|uniref:HTH APSES-type domain-containing protein n=1 Tax=Thyridium curvatum TaxID=1093900 RepID=A0A507BMW9_9PEZI|nr:uncharacterized protein E0L32_011814 [Thyridium curvatum]TPX18090.1 hypothetical protein E0L32_011814 [Thyridium curvatum]